MRAFFNRLVNRFRQRRDNGPRQFERSVSTAFQFLETDYGFTRRPMEVIVYEAHVDYVSAALQVSIHRESSQAPWITLKSKNAPSWATRREFGFHELEQEMEQAGRYQRRPSAPATIDESVTLLAARLRECGDDVLRGDFSILFDRLQRHQKASGVSEELLKKFER